jgi:WXG100 family type VII secretion target
MPEIIHISPTEIQAYAETFLALGAELDAIWTRIDFDVALLQNGGWEGQGADRFFETVDTLRRTSTQLDHRMEEVAGHLMQVLWKFEDLDNALKTVRG